MVGRLLQVIRGWCC